MIKIGVVSLDVSHPLGFAEEMEKYCMDMKYEYLCNKSFRGEDEASWFVKRFGLKGEVTWTSHGRKKIVWRCINRLDFGKKYCHDSPSVEESAIQSAVMSAISKVANKNIDVLKTLQRNIGIGIGAGDDNGEEVELQAQIAKIDDEFQEMLNAISSENAGEFDEEKAQRLMARKNELQRRIAEINERNRNSENAKNRIEEIGSIMEVLKNHTLKYDDRLVRQIIESVIIESKEKVRVILKNGLAIDEALL